MIDTHCHILPKMDDGPSSMEESVRMAKLAIQQGITHIICTPHHDDGVYYNPMNKVKESVKKLDEELKKNLLDIRLSYGQEVRISPHILKKNNSLLRLNPRKDSTFFLLELPSQEFPQYTQEVCLALLKKGYIPIIAHPERNSIIKKNVNRLIPLLKMGVLAQVTAPSVVGDYGREIQNISLLMIEKNLVQIMASDAHGDMRRTFRMAEAFRLIQERFGCEKQLFLKDNALDLFESGRIKCYKFYPIKKRVFDFSNLHVKS